MPFVKRNSNGEITAIYSQLMEPSLQEMEPAHPEIVRFIFGDETSHSSLVATQLDEIRLSDLGLIRVIEDLVGILVDKKVISITDLPDAAIARLQHRQTLRSRLDAIGQILSSEEVGK